MDHAQNVFESPGISTTYTNAPTVGWTRQLTPLVTLSLQAGLQFSTDGSVGAYANASLSYEYTVADRLVFRIVNQVNICHGILREGIHGQSDSPHRGQRGGSA